MTPVSSQSFDLRQKNQISSSNFSLLQIIFSLNTFHTDNEFENPPIEYNPFPRKRTQVLVQ